MKIVKKSRTAQYMALFRALETVKKPDQRLFADPYASDFLDWKLKIAIQLARWGAIHNWISRITGRKAPGALSSGVARTRYIDELLEQALETGVAQVMILGAGFDARALRLPFLIGLTVIEVDHPNTSRYKLNVLRKRLRQLPENITFAEIDFNRQSLDQLAQQLHFDMTRPTAFLWEGVTNYLTADAVRNTFLFVSQFPAGSVIIFTYIDQHVLDDPTAYTGGEKLIEQLEQLDERWTFGLYPTQLADYLAQFGLLLAEDLAAAEYRQKYAVPAERGGYEFYRVAFAKK